MSSSIEATYSSLQRRHERLNLLLEEVVYWEAPTQSSAWEDYDKATSEEQQLIEICFWKLLFLYVSSKYPVICQNPFILVII
ncbi:hypothetical protein EMIT0210MI2_12298 [Priestia megaterium]